MKKLKQVWNLVTNMGPRYVAYRTWFETKKRTGLLHKAFPVNPVPQNFISLNKWRELNVPFFFQSKQGLGKILHPGNDLKTKAEKLLNGEFEMFSSVSYKLGLDYDWLTNPDTNYRYDINKHWLDINDFSKEAGDIKYVWEKSRFSYLLTLIRYEQHLNKDLSTVVFKDILNWIDANPVNQGPNYKCSQEISLRILNWSFALNYYKNAQALTEFVFTKIINSIYWQVKHVYSNINFSRIAVRNNHAITETMLVYLAGLLYPFFPDAEKWKLKGKQWFEQEIAYQIYEDGTYLQFSMNYHRVVIQLLTWGIKLSQLNNIKLSDVVFDRAKASVNFLSNCIDHNTGMLPNYGANDGALFFPLNDQHFRDYRPQLQAFSLLLGINTENKDFEDRWWYGIQTSGVQTAYENKARNTIQTYPIGGFYLIREADCMTFLRCCKHKDRPSQADNLHLDLWVNSINILRDAGSYKYNADEKDINYFFGTSSHNTVMLGENNQMLKGSRFIWYNWSQAIEADLSEHEDYYLFEGSIKAFQQVHPDIIHTRRIKKIKNKFRWEITDTIIDPTDTIMKQIWHPNREAGLTISIKSFDADGQALEAKNNIGWYSSKYGLKETCEELVFFTYQKKIHTIIEVL